MKAFNEFAVTIRFRIVAPVFSAAPVDVKRIQAAATHEASIAFSKVFAGCALGDWQIDVEKQE